ncbi:hypothetical protein V1511DRAFT_503962 [Dipodascopsis uninucleata]
MIRFTSGTPTYIYLSEHDSGAAYDWSAMNITDGRPNIYIANGTHAVYATVGKQDYEHTLGILTDVTDSGILWDVTLNYRGFFYDNSTGIFSCATGADIGGNEQVDEGVSWLSFSGLWGDEQYALDDIEEEQYCISSECHYVTGPTGPAFKNLGRNAVCEDETDCTINSSL